MNAILDALGKRFSIASGPCVSLLTRQIQLPSEHSPASWAALQRKNAKPPKHGKPGPKPPEMTEMQKTCDHLWSRNGYNTQLKTRRYCRVCKWKEVID